MNELLKIIIGGIIYLLSFFIPHTWIYYFVLLISYFVLSYSVFKNVLKEPLGESMLMLIATMGAIFIGEYSEAIAVMLFYQIGEYIGDKAVDTSKREITKLLNLKSDTVNMKVNNSIKECLPGEVKIGDIIVVKPGEKIPLDGIVVKGQTNLDMKALTGEAVPRFVTENNNVLSGSVNLNSAIEIKVVASLQNSTVSKIISRLESIEKSKAKKDKFITKFSKIYTPIVILLACLIFLIPTIVFKQNYAIWLNRALVFLVISCPCALVLSVPLGYFCGIGIASKRGILFKSAIELEELDKIKYVAFDKTGTLTKGHFKVTNIMPSYSNKNDLLMYASYAEFYSNHPIATAIKEAYAKEFDVNRIGDYEEIKGLGVKTVIDGYEVILGNKKFFDKEKVKTPSLNNHGTIVLVAINHNYIGSIMIEDELKETSLHITEKLKEVDINNCLILSGDNENTVGSVASKLNMRYLANLLPDDKANVIENIKKSHKVLFMGDGINDALVISLSDIGVAMGNMGSDVAIEASDIVIMNDDASKIVEGIKISRKTNRIVTFNIIFAIMIKILVMILGAFGIANMWMAVFSDVGVTIITILNALRIFKIRL